VADDTQEEREAAVRLRDQLALAAIVCIILSLAMGMLPDGLVNMSFYRTAAWLAFAVGAFVCFYLAFPHMWVYSIWLAGAYAGSGFGLLLMGGLGRSLFPQYWTALIIGFLFEAAALSLLYSVLIRVRTARNVIGSRSPLGLWFLGIVLFFLFANLSAGSWAWWALTGSTTGLAGYAGFEVVAAFTAVYICWAPEELVWGSQPAGAPPPPAGTEPGPEQQTIFQRLAGKKDAAPKSCPACGRPLKQVQLKCPYCGQNSQAGWCGAHESYVLPCPSCGSPVMTVDGRCKKCGTAFPGMACPACKRTAPAAQWSQQ